MKGKNFRKVLITTILTTFTLIILIAVIILSPYIPYPFFKRMDKSLFENITKTVTLTSEDGNDNVCISQNTGRYVKISSLPYFVPLSFIATEDKRFYQHFGIDLNRIVSSIKTDVMHGKFKEGASTITQQLVKNTHLNQEKTIKRKVNEIRLAIEVEKNYTKEEILEMYLNSLYFGMNVYGIDSASILYFNKHAEDLTLDESAVLVAIINNPTLYNPYTNLENCKKRRNIVLKRMKEQDFITEIEYNNSINKEILLNDNDIVINHYYTAVFAECSDLGINTKNVGCKILSCMDTNLQKNVEEIIKNTAQPGFLTIMIGENKTGKIKAYGSNYPYDISKSRFLPGSTIKPCLCYAPLLENDQIYACSPVLDEEYSLNGYSPSNYCEKYLGNITQQDALAHSSNVVALKNVEKIGLTNAIRFAEKTGLTFDKSDFNNYSTALGGIKYGFTLKELLTSYMTLARMGSKINPSFVNSVYKNGECIYLATNKENQVMKDSTAFLTTQMLKSCTIYGTAKTLKSFNNVASKTGTVGDNKGNDACYCIAYTPNYTILCCITKKNEKLPLSITGGTTPTRIMKEILLLLNDKSDFAVPNSVIKDNIDVTLLKKHQVLLANDTTLEKNKKSYYFSKTNVPLKYNSFEDFINDYKLSNDYNFSIFNCFVN